MPSRNSSEADIRALRTEMREDIAKLRTEILEVHNDFRTRFDKHLDKMDEQYDLVSEAANQVEQRGIEASKQLEKRTNDALLQFKKDIEQSMANGFASNKENVNEKFKNYENAFFEFKTTHLTLHDNDTKRLHWVIGITATLVAAVIVASATVLTHFNILLSLLVMLVGSMVTFWSKITLFFGVAFGSSAIGQKLIRWHFNRKMRNGK